MRTSTNPRWWLGLLVMAVCFASTATAQRTVTLRLNTATIPDTTLTTSEIEVRGCLNGCDDNNSALPGDDVIAWDDRTTLEPMNVGGDYWEVTFQVPDDDTLQFKYFSYQTEASGLNGWEGGGNHQLDGGMGDTTLTLHFFEQGDDRGDYDWRPFASKEDSVGVWFRVYGCTEESQGQGFNPDQSDFGVRGTPNNANSPEDWSSNITELARESQDDTQTGYLLYSGVAYYPADSTGKEYAYKFFLNGVDNGWESRDNRTFTLPAQDTTLHWVTFDDSPVTQCTTPPVTDDVIFVVDTDPLEQIGMFSRLRGDTLQVRGGFNGWDCDDPDDCLLDRVPGTTEFELEVPLTFVPESEQPFKFFIKYADAEFRSDFGSAPPSGWEEPITTQGANRTFAFEGDPNNDQVIIARFNDIFDENIIPDQTNVDVTFSVDMTAAIADANDPFNPATDSVWIDFTGDGIWAFTQGIPSTENDDGVLEFEIDHEFFLTDGDMDGVYTGTFTVEGPTYSGIQYKYAYGAGTDVSTEEGGDTNGPGRRRTRFIRPNMDSSWPATYSFEEESYQPTGDLPFERNPVSVEALEGTLPTQVALSDNYPNPFNPTTSFEYKLDQTAHVKVQVFDVLGRLVSTVVDGVQPASAYRVTFDASALASGTYLYRLEAAGQVITKKMILIK